MDTPTVPTTQTPEMAAEVRKQRGQLLAQRLRITRKADGLYAVPASSGPGSYLVERDDAGGATCSCPDYELRHAPCKHVWAVEYQRTSETMQDGTTKTVQTLKITYTQQWPAYNAAQTHEKEHVLDLLRALCNGIKQKPQTNGRPRLPMSDRAFAVTMKVYGGMSTRRNDTDMRDLVTRGHLSKAPSYNSVCDYMEDPELTPVLQALIAESALPLVEAEHAFAMDSSGFSTCTYRRWFDEKYGKERSEAKWRKAHIAVGVNTQIVTAVRIGDEDSADSPQMIPLATHTARRFDMQEVLADKAYLSEKSAIAITNLGAKPFIPFKITSTGTGSRGRAGSGTKLWADLFHYFHFKSDEFLAHYHQRSNVETAFSMIKRKFGPALRSKTKIAQENELLCKILCHNLAVLVHEMYELGIVPLFWKDAANDDARKVIPLPENPRQS